MNDINRYALENNHFFETKRKSFLPVKAVSLTIGENIPQLQGRIFSKPLNGCALTRLKKMGE